MIYFDLLGVVSALAAAVFWWISAGIEIPPATFQQPEDNPMHVAMRKASKLSAIAALFAGTAAFCQMAQFLKSI